MGRKKNLNTEMVNGEVLRSLIKKSTWVSALAEKAKVSESLIRKMMDGRICEISKIRSVAEALGVGLEDLVVNDASFANEGSRTTLVISSSQAEKNRDDRFFVGIRDWMTEANKVVERLTEEQYRIITMLSDSRRARIQGCAGSGKTMVAAEKAYRCAHAGFSTLFLCHSPRLANNVRGMLKDTAVKVEDFCDWVESLAGLGSSHRGSWSNYDEPDPDALAIAIEHAKSTPNRYSVIIVDEAQDFRHEWWELIENAMTDGRHGVLYIFHDDNQAMLPFRAEYPEVQSTLNLSRNCRNSGNIFTLMRTLFPSPPPGERQLNNIGAVRVFPLDRNEKALCVSKALIWTVSKAFGGIVEKSRGKIVALHSGTSQVSQSPLVGDFTCTMDGWQESVRSYIEQFDKTHSAAHRNRPFDRSLLDDHQEIRRKIEYLSNEAFPNERDIGLVKEIAEIIALDLDYKISEHLKPSNQELTKWKMIADKGHFDQFPDNPYYGIESILYFHLQQRDGLDIPQSQKRTIMLCQDSPRNQDFIPLYRTSDYKGLESDCLILLIDNVIPGLLRELYVGVSRARHLLAVLIDAHTLNALPRGLRELFESNTTT